MTNFEELELYIHLIIIIIQSLFNTFGKVISMINCKMWCNEKCIKSEEYKDDEEWRGWESQENRDRSFRWMEQSWK